MLQDDKIMYQRNFLAIILYIKQSSNTTFSMYLITIDT